MHRRGAWNEKREIKPFRLLAPYIREEDLLMVERYYQKNWPPRTGVNILRHDLSTLINNWEPETDRARIWCEAHPLKPKPRVIIPYTPPSEPYVPSTDPVEIAQRERFMEEYRARKKSSICPETEEAGAPLLNPRIMAGENL